MEPHPIELIDELEKKFPIESLYNSTIDFEYDRITTERTFADFLLDKISAIRWLEKFEALKFLIPEQYNRLLFLCSKQIDIQRKNMLGLISWSEKIDQLVAVKQEVANIYLEIQKVIEESNL